MSTTDERLRLDLAAALQSLGITPAASARALREATDRAVFLEKTATPLLLAEHFEIRPDFLVFDPRVATLGLVEILPAAGDIEAAVRETVDRATYVRHLLQTAPDRGRKIPFAVELVLVAADTGSRPEVGRALRGIARSTTYLHAIGVSELYRQEDGFDEDDLSRAFPWLLRATRDWLDSLVPPEQIARQKLQTVTLENYRLPGTRTLRLDPTARLHLVHGHNGSGKSSLTEAVELAMTGAIDRLDQAGEKSYASVLTNRDATSPARVVLTIEGRTPQESKPEPNPAAALSPGLKASGFRLDQIVMDRLARLGDAQRAVTFLESFFFKESVADKEYRDAERALRGALDALRAVPDLPQPPATEGEALDAFFSRLSTIEPPSGAPDAELFDQILPLPLATLGELTRVAGGLKPQVERWQKSRPPLEGLGAELAQLDEDLKKALDEITGATAQLQSAWDILQGMQGWVANARKPSGQTPAAVLNQWLELCALVDLADKQLQLARSLQGAQQKGWDPGHLPVADLLRRAALSPADLARLESARALWVEDRKRLDEEVKNLRRRPVAPEQAAEAVPSTVDPQLSPDQVEALDEIGKWLLSGSEAEGTVSFGQLVQDAITRREALSYGDLSIGTPQWLEGLRPRIEPLLQACRRAEPVAQSPKAAERFRLLQDAVRKHRDLQARGTLVQTEFRQLLDQLQRRPGATGAGDGYRLLVRALNELMALFTPARWAYENVGISIERPEGETQEAQAARMRFLLLGDKSGCSRADLVFNTAELNVLTLALFLLCSLRTDNRLGLLILDDPLQNMDELTVTTVARGLARLVQILPQPWQLLLLFHGEDDLERFRREVPGAIYLLPWLAPAATEAQRPELIEPQPGNIVTDPQDLGRILTDRPRRRAAL